MPEEFASQVWPVIPYDVKFILVELARRPRSYPSKLLRKRISLPANHIRGRLSLLNHLVHKKHPHRERIYHYDAATNTYFMPAHLATIILALQPPDPLA
jgi:hypothetical protein